MTSSRGENKMLRLALELAVFLSITALLLYACLTEPALTHVGATCETSGYCEPTREWRM
jgi:hypothetical protein